MHHGDIVGGTRARSHVRTLSQHEELPLLRDHLLRLDRASRRDRFHGYMDDGFIERYAEKCANDGTIIIAYFEDGMVRGAAELHPPEQSPDMLPEIAFSVEKSVRRRGVGSFLFRQLIAEARAKETWLIAKESQAGQGLRETKRQDSPRLTLGRIVRPRAAAPSITELLVFRTIPRKANPPPRRT